MNESLKQLLVIGGASVLIFWLLKPKGDGKTGAGVFGNKKADFIKKPVIDDDMLQHEHIRVAYDALCAYIDAYNAKESQSFLDDLKQDFKTSEGMDIYEDANGKLAVRDMDGNDILKY